MPSLSWLCSVIAFTLALMADSAEAKYNEKVVFCIFNPSMFTNTLDLSSFQPNLCTHLLFSSGNINPNNELKYKTMSTRTSHNDNIWKLNDLKRINPRLKMIEWISTARHFPDSSAGRRRFTLSVMKYLRESRMDGISIPGTFCYPLEKESPVALRTNIDLLVEELSEELRESDKELIVSLYASKNPDAVDGCSNLAPLAQKADYIELDFTKFDLFDNRTYFAAPLYSTGDTSIADVVNFVLRKVAQRSKVVMRLPVRGRLTTMNNVPVGGKLSREEPELASISLHEICRTLKEPASTPWAKYWDDISTSPYAIDARNVMAYDDVRSYAEKVKFAKRKGLGGVSIYSLDDDDPKGVCYDEPFPLLRAAHRAIGRTLVTNTTVQTVEL